MPAPKRPAEPIEELRPALEAPQFGLRLLFGLVAVTAVALVIFEAVGPLLAATIVFFGLAILAHVAGNALGTKLTGKAHSPIAGDFAHRSRPPGPVKLAPTTPLSHHRRLGRLMRITTIVAAIVGGTGGGGLLAVLNWDKITIASGALAVTSCAVLGGLLGFWLSSFLQISFEAWRVAHENSDADPAYRRRQDGK